MLGVSNNGQHVVMTYATIWSRADKIYHVMPTLYFFFQTFYYENHSNCILRAESLSTLILNHYEIVLVCSETVPVRVMYGTGCSITMITRTNSVRRLLWSLRLPPARAYTVQYLLQGIYHYCELLCISKAAASSLRYRSSSRLIVLIVDPRHTSDSSLR